ncbi:YbbR-like domain-containing protein [Candidatus Latescibacterota bacterium]
MAQKKYGKNTTAKVLSVLFAFILWFNIATNLEYNEKVDIPIKYIEPSSGSMLASVPPGEAQVYIRGSGKSLIYFSLKRLFHADDSYVSANLAGLPKGAHRVELKEESIFFTSGVNIHVERILTNSVIPVNIDKKIKRTVKVNVDNLPDITLDEHLVLNGKPVANPEFVIIEGPEEIVDPIKSIRVVALEKNVISERDTLISATLEDNIDFASLSTKDITLDFSVEPLRTKLFRIPLKFNNFPQRHRQRVSPDTLSVYIQGPESVVSRSRSMDILISVNYRTYLNRIAQGDSLITPEITYPDGITNVTITPGVLLISGLDGG